MVKTNNKKSLATTIIFGMCIISALVLLLTPIMFLDYSTMGYGIRPIWGWTGVFGGQYVIENYKNFTIDFSWAAYLTILVFVVLGFTVYFVGPKKRGYYIFTAIILALLAVMSFTMVSTWLLKTFHFNDIDKALANLGVGPWISGFLACFGAIACLYEFKTAKLR